MTIINTGSVDAGTSTKKPEKVVGEVTAMARKIKDEDMSAGEALAIRQWLAAHGYSPSKYGAALGHMQAARKRRGNNTTLGAAKIAIEEFFGSLLEIAENVDITPE